MFGGPYSDGRTYSSATKNGTLQSVQPMISAAGEYTLSPAISESEEFPPERRIVRPQGVHEYVLPPAVRDAQQAWTVWSQGIAVTTALFAAVEAQLFNLIDETNGPTSSLTQTFRIFSYLGLLSNLLATTSALLVPGHEPARTRPFEIFRLEFAEQFTWGRLRRHDRVEVLRFGREENMVVV
ncbi:hypothetical protein RSAG8_01934, partial [Rhizoctonia solani AG-8 WAC10335]